MSLEIPGNIDVAQGPNGLIKDITERETLFGIRDPAFREITCKDEKCYPCVRVCHARDFYIGEGVEGTKYEVKPR